MMIVRQIPEGCAPKRSGGHPEQPHKRRPQVARELIAAVDLRGARGDLLAREATHLQTNLLQFRR
jgi:hypothetical protein